jgi:hypothetical protein
MQRGNVAVGDVPVFVFDDDFDVYGSAREAEQAHEDWNIGYIQAAYDLDGNQLEVSVVPGRGPTFSSPTLPANRKQEFVDRLRSYLGRLAQARPELVDRAWVNAADGDELIAWCLGFYLAS